MASTVLPNGIIIPEKFSRDWYADLYHNWQELDNLLGGGGGANDGTLTIQKNGTTVGTFSANQATDETINIEVPTVNNATLTIQKNGTTVDTFTANSSTDKTVDITVPTKTSDLTNDSDFVQSSDLATVATSGNYNDLSNTPTIPTVNNAILTIQKNGTDVATFSANASTNATANITVPTKTSDLTNDSGFITEDTTKIPLAGSNAISGSLIPSTDGTVNLGGTSYQWNNAYIKSLTINGVACGDILTHNASEFVDVSSNQTIGGTKTFSDRINNKNAQQFIFNKEYNDTTDNWLDIHRYLDKNSTRIGFYSIGDFSGNRSFRWFVRGQSTNSVEADIFGFGRKINETSYMYINATLETDLIPTNNNSKSLGTSTNKWKSLNGINPGALSLPGDAYIDIDTTNYAWGSNFTFTPDYDGYCFLSIAAGNNYTRSISLKTGRGEYYFSNQNNIFCFTFPVYKGKLVTILTASNGTESVLPTIRLFPCQGNV